MNWPTASLGSVCELNPKPDFSCAANDDLVSFIPMSAVLEAGRGLANIQERRLAEVSRGHRSFRDGDVLFAKITPCMQNGKHAVIRGLRTGAGFGSTEFHVIRPGPSLLAEWVHLYLIQAPVIESAMRAFTGSAGQQRVPASFLRDLLVPLPPLPEQRRIVGVVKEQLEALERARAAAADWALAGKALARAHVRGLFSSPEAGRWPRLAIGRLGDPARTPVVQTGPFGAQLPSSEFVSEGVPVLNIGNVQWGRLSVERLDHVTSLKARSLERYAVRTGDLLFSRSGTVGRCAVVPRSCDGWLISYHLLRVALDPALVDAQFAAFAIEGCPTVLQQVREAAGRGATRDGVNSSFLSELELPVPPLEVQRRAVAALEERVLAARRFVALAREISAGLDSLPRSLLRRAFGGGE